MSLNEFVEWAMTTVSVCLITRNHGHCLGCALQSVQGWANELIVLDTGSTDDTVTVAARHGALVRTIPWNDDFAAACNQALDVASSEWILWMNPDEELEPSGQKYLNAVMQEDHVFAATVRVQQELREDQPNFGTRANEYRFYRRDPLVRYQGRLHPHFIPPLPVIAESRSQTVVMSDAVIHRFAYLSKPTPDKLRFSVRLLEAELRDRPGQFPLIVELGRTLLQLNDSRGHDVLAEASRSILTQIEAATPSEPMIGSLLEYALAVSPEQNRTLLTRELARRLAIRWFPRTPPVVWALATERFLDGDFAGAIVQLERLVELGQSGDFDPADGFDVDILGAAAYLNLAICHYRLGRWDQAKRYAAGVLSDPTRGEQAKRILVAATAKQAK